VPSVQAEEIFSSETLAYSQDNTGGNKLDNNVRKTVVSKTIVNPENNYLKLNYGSFAVTI
jgi:hypothetical protein